MPKPYPKQSVRLHYWLRRDNHDVLVLDIHCVVSWNRAGGWRIGNGFDFWIEAYRAYPLALYLHLADMEATYVLDGKEGLF